MLNREWRRRWLDSRNIVGERFVPLSETRAIPAGRRHDPSGDVRVVYRSRCGSVSGPAMRMTDAYLYVAGVVRD